MERGSVPSQKEYCGRQDSKRFGGPVTYTEDQLRGFGLVVEGVMRTRFVEILEEGKKIKIDVLPQVIRYNNEQAETRLHPTHADVIRRVSEVA